MSTLQTDNMSADQLTAEDNDNDNPTAERADIKRLLTGCIITTLQKHRVYFDVPNFTQETDRFMAGRMIQFNFIPKRSAWFGSHFERLIGILKNHLKRSIGRNLLTEREPSQQRQDNTSQLRPLPRSRAADSARQKIRNQLLSDSDESD